MHSIGLLGGTFNPPHNGHIRLAIEARERLGLERVELIPAAVPPHRPSGNLLDFEFRRLLLEAAIRGDDSLSVNPVEGERSGPSYTVDTLALLAEQRLDVELVFIMGVGEFTALESWHRGFDLVKFASLAVANRGGSLERAREFLAGHWPEVKENGKNQWTLSTGKSINFFEVPALEISGSEIREKWLSGKSIRGLVDSRVETELIARKDVVGAAWSITA